MIKNRSFIFGTLLTLLLLHGQCKLVDFEEKSASSKINFNVDFEFVADENPLYQIRHLFFNEIYKTAGINPETIRDVFFNDIQFQVIGDNAANDTLNGAISFKIMTPIISPDTLLKFHNIILPPASNNVFSLFSADTTLAIDYSGLEKLKSLLTRSAPPVIVFFFTGTVKSSPVNIQVNIKFDVQIEVNS